MKLRVLSCLLLLVCVGAAADIAPTKYFGVALAPVVNSEVRMESETVDIYVGEALADSLYVRKARVKASFKMVNDQSDTNRVQVGFPIFGAPTGERLFEGKGIYDFRVVVNGTDSMSPTLSRELGAYAAQLKTPYLWFSWEMNFPPGLTVVDVEYGVQTNYTYGRCYQNLGYVMHTGSYWKGSIDRALVRVHFSGTIDPDWFVDAGTTPGYEITSNTLAWSFRDLEPTHDIRVEFMPPELYEKIQALRALHEDEPKNVKTIVALVRAYLECAYVKGPEHSERSEHPDWAGMAEPLLKEAVELDPSNALAWNTYLSSYFKMHDGTFGPVWQQRYPIDEEQRELIRTAHLHCEADSGVGLWYELANESGWELPDTLGQVGNDTGSRAIVRIPTSRYGESIHEFSDEEMDLILSYYEVKGVVARSAECSWLVKNEKAFQPEDRQRMIEILRTFFVHRIATQLVEYNERAGI